ncbi:MAG TPA: hypothetical protein VER79_14990 [Candidatus Limnocylindrales bacterium]|nr:hypothetical protein [Candidatus Limnocylindrales bacterium]
MHAKRWILVAALIAVLLVGVAAVSAGPQRQEGREGGLIAAALEAAIAETGMNRTEIVTAVRAGSTLAEVVTNAGGDVQVVIDAAVAAGQARIDTALANGRVTDAQVAALSADLVSGVTAAVNGEAGPRWVGRQPVRIAAARVLVNTVSEATGLTARDVVVQWRSGRSLGEIASANGSSSEALLDAAVTAATERIDAAVADGSMTQSQADLLLGSLTDRFTEALNAVHTPRQVRGAV